MSLRPCACDECILLWSDLTELLVLSKRLKGWREKER